MTSAAKRVPTPRPVHKPISSQNTYEHGEQCDVRLSLVTPRSSFTLSNKNLNIRGSSLPVKKNNLKYLTDEEIEKELTYTNSDYQYSPRVSKRYAPVVKTSTKSLATEEQQKERGMYDSVNPYSARMSERLKYQATPTKTAKKENKRYSLDVGNITNNYSPKMETRSINVNKRYSLNVDAKKEKENKKSLSFINNNAIMSPKLVSTRSGIVRPQSCVLQSEKVTNSKRSMSVENLPPKLTRLTSRLPVRATDPKTVKPN